MYVRKVLLQHHASTTPCPHSPQQYSFSSTKTPQRTVAQQVDNSSQRSICCSRTRCGACSVIEQPIKQHRPPHKHNNFPIIMCCSAICYCIEHDAFPWTYVGGMCLCVLLWAKCIWTTHARTHLLLDPGTRRSCAACIRFDAGDQNRC